MISHEHTWERVLVPDRFSGFQKMILRCTCGLTNEMKATFDRFDARMGMPTSFASDFIIGKIDNPYRRQKL